MLDTIQKLRENIASVYLGDAAVIDHVIRCLIARGHALIEDVPGVGKTVLASAIAKSIECRFSRIQLTPDLLPADVIGVSVFDRDRHAFEFKPGPIFANIVLADEINRTTPRTQTAMLEAMSEGSVSVDGEVRLLEQPFILLATQNPYDFEGTYPLPENQLDRFLMRISLGYPAADAEATMLDLRPAQHTLPDLRPVMHATDVVELQRRADAVGIERSLRDYIVTFARATRESAEFDVGLSPRGSLALAQTARAAALMAGRDYVVPEDITTNIVPVCAHRVFPTGHGGAADWRTSAGLLEDVLRSIEAPA